MPTPDDLLAQLRSVERERDSLRQELAELGDGNSKTRVAGLESKIREMQEKHQREKEELQQKSTADLSAVWDEHWRRVELIEELRGDQNSFSEGMRETLRDKEKELAELKYKAQSQEQVAEQLLRMEEEMQVLCAGVDSTNEELEQRDSQIAELERQLSDSRSTVSELEAQLSNARSLVAQGEEETARLQAMLKEGPGRMRDQISALEKEIAEARRRERMFTDTIERTQADDRDRELVSTQRALLRDRDEQVHDLHRRLARAEDTIDGLDSIRRQQEDLIREKQYKLDNLVRLVDELKETNNCLRDMGCDGASAGAAEDDRWERSSVASRGGSQNYPTENTATVGSGCAPAGERGRGRGADSELPPRHRGAWSGANSRVHSVARSGWDSSGYSSGSETMRRRAADATPSRPRNLAHNMERGSRVRSSTAYEGSSSRSSSIVDQHARTPVRREWGTLVDGGHQPQPEAIAHAFDDEARRSGSLSSAGVISPRTVAPGRSSWRTRANISAVRSCTASDAPRGTRRSQTSSVRSGW